jgi:protein-S-isoprenylcysteine O-methyltransferase Ste14
MILIIAAVIRIAWVAIEVPYLRRFRVRPGQDWDNRSATIWDIANAIELFGLILGFFGIGRINGLPRFVPVIGLLLLMIGITIRWTAIVTLGRFFTSVVTIRKDHQIIDNGIYNYIRHPAYTGALLAHLGLGLAFGSWVSLSLSVLPFLVAALYRMQVEEKALSQTFGEDYANYMERTHRLIPGVY